MTREIEKGIDLTPVYKDRMDALRTQWAAEEVNQQALEAGLTERLAAIQADADTQIAQARAEVERRVAVHVNTKQRLADAFDEVKALVDATSETIETTGDAPAP